MAYKYMLFGIFLYFLYRFLMCVLPHEISARKIGGLWFIRIDSFCLSFCFSNRNRME